ncbi:MAG: ATP synthase F1 subunit gamma [Pseudomonadota bacterium]|jgi:F-type H+-transporting ATPase subunit gamma|nr:ATP synthase F1 subunit gamma [Alphaproteobacteria bacterium]
MSLKELRRRITSVKSTQKITAAMKMVASAKLRRLQERTHFGHDYIERLNSIGHYLGNIQYDLEEKSTWFSAEGHYDLIIIFGAEKGLCGSFHSNLMRKIHQEMENHSKKQVIIFGQKAAEVLKNRYHFCKNLNVDIQNPTMQTFLNLAKAIEPLKQKKEIGRIHVIGSKFKNILTQQPFSKTLCPFDFESQQSICDTNIFEPSPDVFLPHFFTHYLSANLHQMWIETLTGEMAARMTAMDNATRNAKEMLEDLNLDYNRTRQAKITTELTEIIAGSEGVQQ